MAAPEQFARQNIDRMLKERLRAEIFPDRKEVPKTVLQSFRNEYYPRVAVTVDMIATGTDVRPLEVLLFMRDVRSRRPRSSKMPTCGPSWTMPAAPMIR